MTTNNDSKMLPDLVLDIDDDDKIEQISSTHKDDHLCPENNQTNPPQYLAASSSHHSNVLSGLHTTIEEAKSAKTEIRSTPKRARTIFPHSKGESLYCLRSLYVLSCILLLCMCMIHYTNFT